MWRMVVGVVIAPMAGVAALLGGALLAGAATKGMTMSQTSLDLPSSIMLGFTLVGALTCTGIIRLGLAFAVSGPGELRFDL